MRQLEDNKSAAYSDRHKDIDYEQLYLVAH
jgi:hypothetical protein